MADSEPDLLQGHSGVQQPLDHLENEDVLEAVEALGPRAGGATDGGLNQAGARPVVQLPVGDSCGAAGGGTAVAGVLTQVGKVVGEQQPLSGDRHGTGMVPRFSGGVHASSS